MCDLQVGRITSDGGPACQECPVGTLEQLYRADTHRYVDNIRYGRTAPADIEQRPPFGPQLGCTTGKSARPPPTVLMLVRSVL